MNHIELNNIFDYKFNTKNICYSPISSGSFATDWNIKF